MNAAIWSAIAASFSALSSILIMLIQRRNLQETVRPEIVLEEWSRHSEGEGDGAYEVIVFQKIRNVGRGVASHIYMHSRSMVVDRPAATMSTIRLPILATNEALNIDGRIVLWWKNVIPHGNNKFLPINIVIHCWDSRGMRHETKYELMAVELDGPAVMGTDQIVEGVGYGIRHTITKSGRWLRICGKLARIPLAGRPFRNK